MEREGWGEAEGYWRLRKRMKRVEEAEAVKGWREKFHTGCPGRFSAWVTGEADPCSLSPPDLKVPAPPWDCPWISGLPSSTPHYRSQVQESELRNVPPTPLLPVLTIFIFYTFRQVHTWGQLGFSFINPWFSTTLPSLCWHPCLCPWTLALIFSAFTALDYWPPQWRRNREP